MHLYYFMPYRDEYSGCTPGWITQEIACYNIPTIRHFNPQNANEAKRQLRKSFKSISLLVFVMLRFAALMSWKISFEKLLASEQSTERERSPVKHDKMDLLFQHVHKQQLLSQWITRINVSASIGCVSDPADNDSLSIDPCSSTASCTCGQVIA